MIYYIYDKIKNIISELNKLGIETYIVPLPLSKNGNYFTDYAPDTKAIIIKL